MLRKFGFPAVVFGTVLALAAPIAGLAKDRNDHGRDNGHYSYNAPTYNQYRNDEQAQYDQRAQQVWNVERDARERQYWDREDTQRAQGIRSRGLFSNRYAVENNCR
jgi:hypothetical protein